MSWTAINQDRKSSSRYATLHPLTPPLPKTVPTKNLYQNISVDVVKSLYHIQFTKNAHNAIFYSTFQAFISCESAIKYLPSLDKCVLGLGDDLPHNRDQMIGKHLQENHLHTTNKADGTKLLHLLRFNFFRYKCNLLLSRCSDGMGDIF